MGLVPDFVLSAWKKLFPPKLRPAPVRPPGRREEPRPVGQKVPLRSEIAGRDSRFLQAWVDQYGDLHVDGHDLGPGTAIAGSSSGEYEWFSKVAAGDVPRVVELLGGVPGADVMAVIAGSWVGRGDELERLLRESDIRVERFVWFD